MANKKNNKKELNKKSLEQVSGGMYFPNGNRCDYGSVPQDASTDCIPKGIVAEKAKKLKELLPTGKK